MVRFMCGECVSPGARLQLRLQAGAALGDDGVAAVGDGLALPPHQRRSRALLLPSRLYQRATVPACQLRAIQQRDLLLAQNRAEKTGSSTRQSRVN